MKKFMFTLVTLLTMAVSTHAMSYEQARQQALFLADKMAYELNLTDEQYEAVYEINLDYLMGVRSEADLYGDYWMRRNLDMSYILMDWQYRLFCDAAYFYRPLYWSGGYWHFHIYSRYHRDYFYFGRPHFYDVYRGGHSWHHNGGHSWYNGRTYAHHSQPNRPGMRDHFTQGHFGRGGTLDGRPSKHGPGIGSDNSSSRTPGNRGGNRGGYNGNDNNRGNGAGNRGGNRGGQGSRRDNGSSNGSGNGSSNVQHGQGGNGGSHTGGGATPQRRGTFGGNSQPSTNHSNISQSSSRPSVSSTPSRSAGSSSRSSMSSSTPRSSISSGSSHSSMSSGSSRGGSSMSSGSRSGGSSSGGSRGGGHFGGGRR